MLLCPAKDEVTHVGVQQRVDLQLVVLLCPAKDEVTHRECSLSCSEACVPVLLCPAKDEVTHKNKAEEAGAALSC